MQKKFNKKKNNLIFGLIFIGTLIIASIPSFISFHAPITKNNGDFHELKSSGIYYDIDINDFPGSLNNWTWATTQPWFGGGSGTELDPYIIEDDTFMYSSGVGECIRIFNSRKHFIIRNCTIVNSHPAWAGIHFSNVTNGDILNNQIIFNGFGIVYIDGSNTTISNNNISTYTTYGIWLIDDSDNNIINGNTVNGNGGPFGIDLDTETDNNIIYENYFSNHATYNANDDGTNNDWNNTMYGNYWDDYTGFDMDLDGIGDDPHSITGSAGNFDFLPIWNIQSPIAIDDLPGSPNNWAWAVTQAWCTGSGTFGDPYIIENLKIHGNSTHSCIKILNSNSYFVIDHCELDNSVSGNGIFLSNVTNGRLTYNYLYNNSKGVYLNGDCDFNVISHNTAYKNRDQGIRLNLSNNNTITGNTLNNNGGTSNFHGLGVYNSDGNSISNNIANDNNAHGIRIFSSEFNTLTGNILENNGDRGISIDTSSHHNTLLQNTANNNTNYGIYMQNSNFNIVSENNASDNNVHGIRIYSSEFNTLTGNILENNGDRGISIDSSSHNNTLLQNTANSNTNYGIYIEDSNFNVISENTASDNALGNFCLLNSNNNTLYKNEADEISTYGIYLVGSDFNDIIECEVYNITSKGIYLLNSHNNTISKNIVMYNLWGLFAEFSNENTFSSNTFNNNTQLGMAVENSYSNKILENTANFNMNTWGGIMVSISVDTLVQGNTLIGNNPRGIGIIFGSDNNNATGNIVKENTIGVEIESGSDNNLIYENIFVKNGMHAVDDGSNNDWNSTTIGNYWDNHTGPDISPVDGIVDTPYTFIGGSAGSIDHLPIAEDGPPSVVINTPSEFDIFGAVSPSFSVTITDTFLDDMWYTIDGGLHNFTFIGSTGTIDQSAWDAITDGLITLTFYASDLAENIGSANVNIEKDNQGPLIVINSPITDDIFGASAPSFAVEISDDNLDSMWYSLDGGTTTFLFTANGTINQAAWIALAEGPITITFYANDTVGNLASESVDVVKELPSPPGGIPGYELISLISTILLITGVLTIVLSKRNKLR